MGSTQSKNDELPKGNEPVYKGAKRTVDVSNTNTIQGVEDSEDYNHRKVTLFVVGAGMRGNCYAQYAKDFPNRLEVVGIAEPRQIRRTGFQQRYNILDEKSFTCWREAAKEAKFADAVVIATLDDQHYEPCLAFADLGYHILCEKPMAPTEKECAEMVEAAKKNDVILAIGHVLRYTNEYMTIKKLIDEKAIGDLIGIQHLEPVGWWHYAHSYVRGNWKKEIGECGSLMAKSCHDLDLIKYFMGNTKCTKIQSFGALTHFKSTNKPENAANNCLDCPIERECPYSAVKQYIDVMKGMGPDGFCKTVCETDDIETMKTALREGPYGKCVYSSDNDVCDYQTVNMEFEGGKYATFIMSAFTKDVCTRKIRLFGTKGQIETDGKKFELFDFSTEKSSTFKASFPQENTFMRGHGFADYHLMKAFVKAVAYNDKELIKSGPEDSLRGHRLVFAAEKSRKQGGVMLDIDI